MPEQPVSRVWVLAGALPVAAIAAASVWNAPSPFAPASFFALFPGMWLSDATTDRTGAVGIRLIPVLAAAIYLLGSTFFFVRQAWAWRATVLLFLLLGVGDALFLLFTISDGVQYEGGLYSGIVVTLNVLCAAAVGRALVIARRRESWAALVVGHVGLFCWLNWVAFPWFGEMP